MSETSSSTALTTADPQDAPAVPALTRFLYARHAPIQSIRLKGEGLGRAGDPNAAEPDILPVDFRPGRPVRVPAENKVVVALIASGYLSPAPEDEAAPAPIAPVLSELAENDTRRVEAIASILSALGPDDLTSTGKPKAESVERLAGFKPTTSEIRAAQAANDLSKEA